MFTLVLICCAEEIFEIWQNVSEENEQLHDGRGERAME